MKPYYQDVTTTIYHGDCREVWPPIPAGIVSMVTDPPFGIDYKSGWEGTLSRSILGDSGVELRDWALHHWDGPALVFGSWRMPRPLGTRMVLVWDTGGALGMGDLSLPWKPSHQEIYVISGPFSGERTTDVLRFPPIQSMAANGRLHPHEKPVGLLKALIAKTTTPVIFDPFMGVGSTLVAAKAMGRTSIGIEIEERYCEIAVRRLSQQTLGLSA